jgi:hypothetical protein
MKKVFTDPNFIFLLLGNLFCIYYFQTHTNGFGTVVWIYWFQSMVIGLFNFLDLLTVKNYEANKFKINDQPLSNSNKGCSAFFFLVHYGGFHLAYFVFLSIKYLRGADFTIILISIGLLLLEGTISFIRRKQNGDTINYGTLFMLPYVRIVPMHLMILAPAFFGMSPSAVFLILKTLADIIFFFLSRNLYKKVSSE